MIESGSRGQGSPDYPQDTPPGRRSGLFLPSQSHVGFRWGLGVVGVAVVLISVMVLGSYHGRLTDEALAAPGPNQSASVPTAAEHGVPTTGSGQVHVARFTRAAPGEQTGRTVRVRVEVERDLPTDPEKAAAQMADILQDRRSWPSKQRVRFAFAGEGGHDLVLRVLTPATTDKRCHPLRTLGEVSCSVGNAVNLNAVRWEVGIPDYAGDLDGYRTYLVNHEVGHYLGRGHVECPGPGQPAPVMMQQTKGLLGCARNPWP